MVTFSDLAAYFDSNLSSQALQQKNSILRESNSNLQLQQIPTDKLSFPNPALKFLSKSDSIGATNTISECLINLQPTHSFSSTTHSYHNIKKFIQKKRSSPSLKSSQLNNTKFVKNTPLEALLREVGTALSYDMSKLQALLVQFAPLDEQTVAQIISMIANYRPKQDRSDPSAYQALYDLLISSLTSDEDAREKANNEAPLFEAEDWYVDALVSAFKTIEPTLDWYRVASNYDQKGVFVKDERVLEFIVEAHNIATGDVKFPASVLMGVWKNVQGQLSFLSVALNQAQSFVSFDSLSPRTTLPDEIDISSIDDVHIKNWSAIPLVETLEAIAEVLDVASVQRIFDIAIDKCPEVLAMTLLSIGKMSSIHGELLTRVFAHILRNAHAPQLAFLKSVREKAAQYIIYACYELWVLEHSACLPRILDLMRELKMLSDVLSAPCPFPFLLDLAALAARRDYLNFEKWISDHITEYGQLFIGACISFLSEKMLRENQKSDSSAKFSLEVTAVIFKCLHNNIGMMSEGLVQDLKKLYANYLRANPRLTNSSALTESSPSSSSFNAVGKDKQPPLVMSSGSVLQKQGMKNLPDGPAQTAFDSSIDEEANSYFQQVYAGKITIENTVSMLKRFRDSSNTREQQIYACMIHNLFDEYRFFHKYPERELNITGSLFGALIRYDVLSPGSLGIALRYVLEALRISTSSKMTMFGLCALQMFKNRLHEWPKYCSRILQIPHLQKITPDLFTFVEAAMNGTSGGGLLPGRNEPTGAISNSVPSPPPVRADLGMISPEKTSRNVDYPQGIPSGTFPGAIASMDSVATNSTSAPSTKDKGLDSFLGNNVAIESLLAMNIDANAPDEIAQDKIHFIFNNLSATNIDMKKKELSDFLKPEWVDFLAQYVVVKRASIEPNFHELYFTFLEKLESTVPKILKKVLSKSYENVRVLVSSEKIRNSTSERSLLKNLGSWIGILTLGRNKPILIKDLDMKHLIFKAYSTGRLIAVIPFEAKVLDACAKSKIFRPPNPWLAAILGLLKEIYNLSDLKLNLKFEVEVLCKNISVDLREIQPTEYLKELPKPTRKYNPDFASKKPGTSPLQSSPSSSPVLMAASPPSASPNATNSVTGSQPIPFSLSSLSSNMGSVNQSSQQNLQSQGLQSCSIPKSAAESDDKVSAAMAVAAALSSSSLSAPQALHMAATAPPANAAAAAAAAAAVAAAAEGVTVIPNLAHHITINPSLVLFQSAPALKRLLPVAVDRAVREIIQPVVERSCTISCITTRELVLKDFSNESDLFVIRKATQQMAQNLAGSLALVTSKEHLRVSMGNHLRSLLLQSAIDSSLLEQTVQVAVAENLEVGCAIIERAATEKAARDIDESINSALLVRRKQQQQQLQNQSAINLPDALKYGAIASNAMRVYDDFDRISRLTPSGNSTIRSSPTSGAVAPESSPTNVVKMGSNVPPINLGASKAVGTKSVLPTSQKSLSSAPRPQGKLENSDILNTLQVIDRFFGELYPRLVSAVAVTSVGLGTTSLFELPPDNDVQSILSQIPGLVRNSSSPQEAGTVMAQKIFKRLYEGDSMLHRQVHVAILESLRQFVPTLPRDIVTYMSFLEEHKNLNRDCAIELLRHGSLLNMPDYDALLMKLVDNGRNIAALDFAAFLIKRCILNDEIVTTSELPLTIECLSKIASRPNPPLLPSAPNGLDVLLNGVQKVGLQQSPTKQAESYSGDSSTLRTPVAVVLEKWVRLYLQGKGNQRNYNVPEHVASVFVTQSTSLFDTDEAKEKFFRIACDIACESTYRGLAARSDESDGGPSPYRVLDAYSKLIVAIVRPETSGLSTAKGITSLSLALLTVVRNLLRTSNSASRSGSLDLRPHFRLLHNLISDLSPNEKSNVEVGGEKSEGSVSLNNFQVLSTFANVLHAIHPQRAPSFAFCWLELMSYKKLMPRLLASKLHKGWPYFQRLVVDLLSFLSPHLQNDQGKMTPSIKQLYRGTLRVLLVLLHDFPEFLCGYHFSLCDVIPSNCIQLRNLVLSAFPSSMRLPDPFLPDLRIETLPEMTTSPRILSNYSAALSNGNIKTVLDNILRKGPIKTYLEELEYYFKAEGPNTGTGVYNIPLISSVVFYIGMHAIQRNQSGSTAKQLHVDIFLEWISEADSECRYHIFNAMANQLRYPNNHTYYFGRVILHCFLETKDELIREQITRVLMERLIANRPHPWGLLVTFIELIKNAKYNFWSHNFVRCTPEIEQLFENVAKSCLVVTQKGQNLATAGEIASASS